MKIWQLQKKGIIDGDNDGQIYGDKDGKNDSDNDGIIDGDNDGKQKDNEAVAWSPCGDAFAR